MRSLYEIEDDILACVDQETGEIVDVDKLNALEMERNAKIEGVILWRKDLLAEADAVEAEYKSLYDRVSKLRKKAEQLKAWTNYALQGEKFKTARCSVSYRKSTSIVIDDITKIPKSYLKDIREDWISKSTIKDALEHGIEVEGAHQEEKQSIIIK